MTIVVIPRYMSESGLLANLQTRHRDQRQQRRADPESHDDFDFVLALKQKMVVERAAGDQAVAGHFEPADLGDHAERLDDEDTADQDEQDFLAAG